MPNQKLKNENYTNFGGINSKVSPYANGPMEFLDLTNVDFQTPGSLTQRWGTTQMISGTSFVGKITGLHEYIKSSGESFIMFGTSGSIWAQTATNAISGLSLSTLAGTTNTQAFFGEILRSGGNWIFTSRKTFWDDEASIPMLTFGGAGIGFSSAIDGMTLTGLNLDFVVANNWAYMCDGKNFLKWNGATLTRVGIPPVVSNQPSGTSGASYTIRGGAASTVIALAAAYVNDYGQEGQITPLLTLNTPQALVANGQTSVLIDASVYAPTQFQTSKLNVYAYQFPAGASNVNWDSQSLFNLQYSFYKSIGLTGGAYPLIAGSTTDPLLGETPRFENLDRPQRFQNKVFGFTTIASAFYLGISTGSTDGGFRYLADEAPSMLEYYQNRLFLAGFSAAPSTLWYSDVGSPDTYDPEAFIEVRTNDGDRVTAIKATSEKLIVLKQNSVHQLTGDSPENFTLREVTTEFGCLNNRCVATYGDLMAFLDKKGIVEYNGAGLALKSFPIQPLVDRINYAAAVTNAIMAHDKSRNQLMVGVPIDGATLNNVTLVYDYYVNAWTKYDNFVPSIFAQMKSALLKERLWFGTPSGTIHHFGESFLADSGAGFTAYIKTRFLGDLGQSTEKQWRKLWVNVDDTPGATTALNISLFKNFGSSIVETRSIFNTPFQSNTQFGVSSKSLAFEMSKFATTCSFRFHGFSLEYRYQRGD